MVVSYDLFSRAIRRRRARLLSGLLSITGPVGTCFLLIGFGGRSVSTAIEDKAPAKMAIAKDA